MPEKELTRVEMLWYDAKFFVPRIALGAVAMVGGAFLLWGANPEPSPQHAPAPQAQPYTNPSDNHPK